MPDLDLEAIREKHEEWLGQRLTVSRLIREEADDATIAAAEAVAVRLSDTTLVHLPALLADHDRLAAEVRTLRADRDGLLRDRDDWRRIATLPADCPVDGCGGERFELERVGVEAPIVRMSCGHDPGDAQARPPPTDAPSCPPEPPHPAPAPPAEGP